MSAVPSLPDDALQTVAAWPEHAPSWWRLIECADALAPAERAGFVAVLRDARFGSAQGQWFQQTALHHLTGDGACLVRLAQLAPSLPGAERWMTLANVVWWSALSRTDERSAFRQAFLDTNLPQLLARLGDAVAGEPRGAPAPRRDVLRVAIVAQHLANGRHAPTALTFDLRAVLEGAGVATRVFGAQELDQPAMRGHTAAAYVSLVAPIDGSTWQLRRAGEVAVTVADLRYSLLSRWRALAQLVGEYDPDVVLFVGFYSPLVSALRRRHPVLGMSLHTLPPLAPVDAWLAADPSPGGRDGWPGLPQPRAIRFPFRFWPAAAPVLSRGAIGVDAGSVLLVSAGARLDPRVLADWFDGMLRFLDEQPGAEWLLVGLAPADVEALAKRHPRLHALPHRDDLAGWIAISDIYVNPPRVGGGASVAIAMQLGVPVVALQGGDGGDKIAPMAAASPQEYRARLAQWCGDRGARAREGERLKAKFATELDLSTPAAATRLLEACREAQRCFAERGTGT